MSESVQRQAVPTVLAVEDNPGDIRLIEEGIEASGRDVELHVSRDGTRAIEWLAAEATEENLDLVLLDLNLSGKSGFEVLQAVRDEPRFDSTPIVVVSSSEDPTDVRRVYERSASGYVTKPTDPDEYIRMIVAAVDFWIFAVTSQPIDD